MNATRSHADVVATLERMSLQLSCSKQSTEVRLYGDEVRDRCRRHRVKAARRSEHRAARWTEHHGGKCAKTLAEAVEGADIVFTCLSDDDAMAQVASEPDWP